MREVDAATRQLQYAIARHLKLWYIVAMFFPLFSSERQPLKANHERQERGTAWPSGPPPGRELYQDSSLSHSPCCCARPGQPRFLAIFFSEPLLALHLTTWS